MNYIQQILNEIEDDLIKDSDNLVLVTNSLHTLHQLKEHVTDPYLVSQIIDLIGLAESLQLDLQDEYQ